jgi:uncharacterized protein YcbK (DUF882 family)
MGRGKKAVLLRARVLLAGLTATVALCGIGASGLTARPDSDRTLSFYNIHTKERLTVTYMRDGKRDPEAMKKIDWMMRDWRRDEATNMDPELIDLIWEVHSELGSKEPIHIISGFRSSRTNEKLRSKGGGQAKNSRHILGKAADIHFPDVPLKQLRYSGLVRERGGVGYYPTSGVPFVHLDTGRVRHWPRMPRYELALLFPDGKSKHRPADGRPLSRRDYVVAKSRYQELAQQVAAFFNLRNSPKPTLLADAGSRAPGAAPPPATTKTTPAARAPELRVASLAPVAGPQLIAAPRPIARPAQPKPAKAVSTADRSRLASLFSLAAWSPAPALIKPPSPVTRETPAGENLTGGAAPAPALNKPATAQSRLDRQRVAAIDPAALDAKRPPRSISDIERSGWSTGWASAPEFDEEHPDEMSYRPFPVAPLLTETESADDPVLAKMEHPDVKQTLDMLGEDSDRLPLKLRPGPQVVAMMWAQQFQGNAVDLSSLNTHDGTGALSSRRVRTSAR